ncbi:MAG: c-type cytochrome [Lentisphaerales bacterium]|nr:c-type cytochrome [Lentisphaerales bacterium]
MRKFIFGTAATLTALSLQAGVDFKKDIAPIFESRCVKCHGERKQKGEYRLENAKDIVKAGDSEEAPIVAGKPEASYLLKLVSMSEDDDDVMPPKGGTLTKDEVAKIKAWIAEGAKFPAGLVLKDKSPKK